MKRKILDLNGNSTCRNFRQVQNEGNRIVERDLETIKNAEKKIEKNNK